MGIETVAVYFRNDDILQEASPGESLASVASRSGVDIPYGCHTGKCGVCEVELRKFGPAGDDKEGLVLAGAVPSLGRVAPRVHRPRRWRGGRGWGPGRGAGVRGRGAAGVAAH